MFPKALRREVLILLAIKASLLAVLYVLFFSPVHHPRTVPMSSHILGDG